MKSSFKRTKKTVLIVVILTLSHLFSPAQEYHGGVNIPSYKEGNKTLREFIAKNLAFPEADKEKGISGTVSVSLLINGTGKVDKIALLRGISESCDTEALRVARLLNNWQPAMNWGKPVKCNVILPIEFKNDRFRKDDPYILSGTVTDIGSGKPIEGALILIKGTSIGTMSDQDGKYNLEIPGGKNSLTVSAIGYELKDEPLANNRTINIELNKGYCVINLNEDK